MARNVASKANMSERIIRNKSILIHNSDTMKAVIQAPPFGSFTTDEPVRDGAPGEGLSPLQAALGALCGCKRVTSNRTAAEPDFEYSGIELVSPFTIELRGRPSPLNYVAVWECGVSHSTSRPSVFMQLQQPMKPKNGSRM